MRGSTEQRRKPRKTLTSVSIRVSASKKKRNVVRRMKTVYGKHSRASISPS